MRLYHYTSVLHLPNILHDQKLTLTDSNVDLLKQHAGPDVVWLTRQADLATSGAKWTHPSLDKLAVRFTVNVNAMPWPEFARKQHIKRQWYVILARTGGDPTHWYVCTHEIEKKDWREVLLTRSNLRLDVASYNPAEPNKVWAMPV